jgi:hypothetical protein
MWFIPFVMQHQNFDDDLTAVANFLYFGGQSIDQGSAHPDTLSHVS